MVVSVFSSVLVLMFFLTSIIYMIMSDEHLFITKE